MKRWCVLWLLVSCTDLGPVDRDRCGNGVVEPAAGEDCDRDDPSCAACRLTCGDTSPCPAGAACGLDGVCHAPAQTFTATAGMRWTARSLLVGDTTGDRYPELVGISDQAIAAHLGGPDATYATSVTVPNLQVFDQPRMADLDGDRVQDLVIPIGFGLYALAGNGFSVLQPLFQNTFAVPSLGRFVATSVNFTVAAPTVPGRIPENTLFAAFRLPPGPDCPVATGCDVLSLDDAGLALPGPLARLAGDELAWAWIEDNARLVTAVAFTDDPATTADDGAVYLYRVDIRTDPGTVDPLGLAPVAGRVRGPAWLADLDGDDREDLVVATTYTDGTAAVSVAWGRGDGTFDPAAYLMTSSDLGAAGLDPVRWGDLNADKRADFVSTSGIRIASCLGRICTYRPTLVVQRAWTHAQLADVTGDGRLDVVAHGAERTTIDVLRATEEPAIWNDAPIAAPGVVRSVRTGDFDGNGVADVAFVTAGDQLASADLYTAFGTPGGGPPSPTYMGYVGELVAMDRTSILVPGRLDDIDDLVVIGERGGERGAAFVLGSSSQRMIGPLVPIGDPEPIGFDVEAVVAAPLDGDATADVAVLMTETRLGNVVDAKVRVYAAAADGALHQRTGEIGVPLEVRDFLLRGTRWTALPAGAGRTLLTGIDRLGRTRGIAVGCTADTCTFSDHFDRNGAGPGGESLAADTADLDGDGRADLFASFDQHVRVWFGTEQDLGEPAILALPAGVNLPGLVAIDLDLDGRRELVGLGGGRLYRSSAPTGRDFGAFEPFDVVDASVELAAGLSLTAADVNGDGLPDLVATFGLDRDAPQRLEVLVQGEARGALASHP